VFRSDRDPADPKGFARLGRSEDPGANWGGSNPADASRDDQPSRVPAVTTQAWVGPTSRLLPVDPVHL
jgi:hypothetical protein